MGGNNGAEYREEVQLEGSVGGVLFYCILREAS
jgi:hypothetical protein